MRKGVNISKAISNVLALISVMWLIELINIALNHSLCNLGIMPRTYIGLIGIVVSPFVHYGIAHLSANTIPLAVLGGLIALSNSHLFNRVTFFVIIFGGFAVWLLGRPAYHVGASGLIFGYFGFLVARGLYERSFVSLLVALVVIFFYGSMIWGVFPVAPYISWEAHLFGFIAGIAAARFL
jgi:membrane associated rhomboid family serine protease